jgi:outer membrane protein
MKRKTIMKRSALALPVIALALSANAAAQESPRQVRARVVHLDPADKSDPVGGTGPANLIAVSDKTIPELDISYFFHRISLPSWC